MADKTKKNTLGLISLFFSALALILVFTLFLSDLVGWTEESSALWALIIIFLLCALFGLTAGVIGKLKNDKYSTAGILLNIFVMFIFAELQP